MISVGQKLDPGFRVKVVRNGRTEEMSFADLLDRRTIVSVYMKNKTPTCDRQTRALAEVSDELDRAGYNVVALSRDTAGSHARYAAANDLPFALVSDPQDAFARAADALVEKSMYGRTFIGPARSAYVLDPDGTVLAVIEKVEAGQHAAQLRAAIKSL